MHAERMQTPECGVVLNGQADWMTNDTMRWVGLLWHFPSGLSVEKRPGMASVFPCWSLEEINARCWESVEIWKQVNIDVGWLDRGSNTACGCHAGKVPKYLRTRHQTPHVITY